MFKLITKLILFLICVSIVVVYVPFTKAFAAENGVSAGGDIVKEADLLSGLNIIRKDDTAAPNFNESITRLDCLKYILRFAKADGYENTSAHVLNDTTDENAARAAALGIISTESGDFRPKDYATYFEAIAMVINAMGYKNILNSDLSYPENYIQLARTLDMECGELRGNNDGIMTYNGLFEILYKALEAPVLKTDQFVSGKGTYSFSNNTTYLEDVYKVYKTTGIVNCVYEASLLDSVSVGKDTVRIDDITYQSTDSKIGNFLGYRVEVYYSEQDTSSADRRIISIGKKASNELVVSAKNFDKAKKEGGKITVFYTEKYKDKSVSLDSAAKIIYNGKPYDNTKVYAEWFDIEYGNITFIDNDDKGEYDIALINSYKTMVVSSVDLDEEEIYGKYSSAETLCLKDSKVYRILDENMKSISLSDIHEGNVISVMKSKDGSIVNVLVSAKREAGRIDARYTDTYDMLTFAGKEYICIAPKESVNINLNEDCTIYFDVFGSVADIVYETEDTIKLGYFLAMEKGSIGSDWEKISILPVGGDKPILYKIADRVRLDGRNIKNKDINNGCGLIDKDGGFIQCAVKYSLNNDGNVDMLDTPELTAYEDKKETMHKMYSFDNGGSLLYKANKFGTKAALSPEKTMLVLEPSDKSDISAYKTFDAVSLTDSQNYNVDIYTAGVNKAVGVVVVFKNLAMNPSNIVYDKTPMYVFDRMYDTIDDDGISVKQVVLNKNGSEYKMIVQPEYYSILPIDLGRGDVVRISRNTEGEMTALSKVFDYKTKKVLENADTLNTMTRIVGGYVYNVEDTYFRIARDMVTLDEDKIEVVNSGGGVYIYDVTDNGVQASLAKTSDIRTYENAGNEATIAICHLSFEETKSFLLFKNKGDVPQSNGDYYAMFKKSAGDSAGAYRIYANAGESITLLENTFENQGFKFVAWTDGYGEYHAGESYSMPRADVVFYAVWEPAYSISFSSGTPDTEGNAPDTIYEISGGKIILPQNTYTRIGYKFSGWKDSTGTIYQPGNQYTVGESNIVFEAVWQKAYSAVFEGGNNTSGTAPVAIGALEGEKITLPENTFIPETYSVGRNEFAGWTTDGGVTLFRAGDEYSMPGHNLTFTAVWKYAGESDKHIDFNDMVTYVAMSDGTGTITRNVTMQTPFSMNSNNSIGECNYVYLKVDLAKIKNLSQVKLNLSSYRTYAAGAMSVNRVSGWNDQFGTVAVGNGATVSKTVSDNIPALGSVAATKSYEYAGTQMVQTIDITSYAQALLASGETVLAIRLDYNSFTQKTNTDGTRLWIYGKGTDSPYLSVSTISDN